MISIERPNQTQLTGKKNSLIHTSAAIHLAPAPKAWPQRHALKEPLQEIIALTSGFCTAKPRPLAWVLPASHVGSHHGWGWPWVNGGAEWPGRMLD